MNINELIKVLRSSTDVNQIDNHRTEIISLIPIAKVMIGFDQMNLAHQYNLWEHSLQTVVNLPKDIEDDMLYLAAFLHDIGKPDCQVYGERDGRVNMHYYGHAARGVEIIKEEIVPGFLKHGEILSEDEQIRLFYYVGYHDVHVSLRIKHLRKHLNIGASLEEFRNLMKLQIADAKAHVLLPFVQNRIEICNRLAGEYSEKLYRDILDGK